MEAQSYEVLQVEPPSNTNSFIEANTIPTSLEEMKKDHIIPVFVKDNEPLISHTQFIDVVKTKMEDHFHGEQIARPSIRVSHPIKGRVPEAKHKAAEDLLPWETTLYYERMMFAIEIPSINEEVGGNTLSLTVGGVKSYHMDNLYSRSQSEQHFKLFIGFQNKVCCNMCVWTDGYLEDVRVKDIDTLKFHIHRLLERYRNGMHLDALRSLTDLSISEQEFAQFIGKCRMYNHLPAVKKNTIKPILFGDQQLGMVVRDYYKDKSFSRLPDGSISLWKLYNLLTGVNKSTYIDQFLDRNINAYDLVEQLKWGLQGSREIWYLN
jgi:hypothetical protein